MTKATANEVDAVITVAPDAEPGRHDLRLTRPHGSTLASFDVGVLPERNVKQPNQTAEQAETITFPTVVNGIVGEAHNDYYKFQVNAGQTVVFDVLATRNGANTDAVISALDQSGEELAYNDDYYGSKDPHTAYTFERQGIVRPAESGHDLRAGQSAGYGADYAPDLRLDNRVQDLWRRVRFDLSD